MQRIDLRSDTVTLPSYPMRAAMANAPVGDDQYGEDPRCARCKRRSRAAGQGGGAFVPSGTMANQIGLKLLTRPGDDVVVGDEAHSSGTSWARRRRIRECSSPWSDVAGCLLRPTCVPR